MQMGRWMLMGMMVLLVVGCGSPDAGPTPVVSATSAPRTATLVPTPTVPPTPAMSTAAPTPTRPVPTIVPTEPLGDSAVTGRRTTVRGRTIRIRVLYDNNPGDDERLRTAWGFSCLVEGLDKTILFDTGGDSATLLHNMRVLGVDPQDIEVVVVSHVHGDHVGGLSGLLAENDAVTVYLPQSFPADTKAAVEKAGAELVEVDGPVEICDYVRSTGELGDWIKEQALVVEAGEGLVVITGCAHPGIVGIVRRAKELIGKDVHLVLGGFHLGGMGAAEVEYIVEAFHRSGVQRVAPCHCSGDLARRLFEESYGDDFVLAGVGTTMELQD